MQFSLVVLSQGGQHGKKIPITLPQFLIGRDHHCHLRPVSTLVSKRHCAFKVTQTQVIIQDLNSTNGTFVNDERLIGSRVLKDGDVIKLGPLTFRADIKAPVAVDEPTPPPGKSIEPLPSSPVVAPEEALAADEPSTIGPGGATPEQADPDFSIDDEEDIAALLMDDEGGDIARDDPSVPDDLSGETTAMEMMLPPEMQEPKKKEKTEEEKKVDTSSAAAEILNKMYRRR